MINQTNNTTSNASEAENVKPQVATSADIAELTKKYCDLVWYARKEPNPNAKYWDGVPEYIKQGAFNSMSKVEEQYPDEVDELKSDHGDWTHGFNSGCLAAFRYVLTSMYPHYSEEHHDWFGGKEDADLDFPELDT